MTCRLQERGSAFVAAIDEDYLVWWAHTTLLPLYERNLTAITWCPRWWDHPEAVFRMELIRRAWQDAVAAEEGQALSDWMLHTVDPHMAVLTSSNGPFAKCHWNERRGYSQPHQPRGLVHHWPEDFPVEEYTLPAHGDVSGDVRPVREDGGAA